MDKIERKFYFLLYLKKKKFFMCVKYLNVKVNIKKWGWILNFEIGIRIRMFVIFFLNIVLEVIISIK